MLMKHAAPLHQILRVRRVPGHTVRGRFNHFKPLRRHFRVSALAPPAPANRIFKNALRRGLDA